jgi:hypothetical protein
VTIQWLAQVTRLNKTDDYTRIPKNTKITIPTDASERSSYVPLLHLLLLDAPHSIPKPVCGKTG